MIRAAELQAVLHLFVRGTERLEEAVAVLARANAELKAHTEHLEHVASAQQKGEGRAIVLV